MIEKSAIANCNLTKEIHEKFLLTRDKFCVLALFASPAFAGEQMWTFDADADDWTPANGTWSVEAGTYKLAKGAAEHALISDAAWNDDTVEANVQLDEGNWAGIVFRAQSEMAYYVYYLNVPNNKTELWRHKTGAWDARDKIGELAGVNVTIANGEWFDMEVVIEGAAMKLWINGEEQGELTDDTAEAYTAGQAGVWAWETAASFDDFKVSGDVIVGGGTPVEPLDKLTTARAASNEPAETDETLLSARYHAYVRGVSSLWNSPRSRFPKRTGSQDSGLPRPTCSRCHST